MIMVSVSM